MPALFDRKSQRTWIWIILIVSLGLNAFLIGVKATDIFRERNSGADRGPRIVRTELRWLKDRLSPDAVKSIETALDPIKPDILARIERVKALRAELDQLVAAPTPDRAAIDNHLREIRLEVGAMQEQVQSRTFDALLALPVEQRAPLARPSPSPSP
ncbi:periplasmic heavy metal sensor [Kaistia dalseonensis]|uniref:Membrane protein n=1 Tax=Kaistia dalseonensis TaxID=410840 RepID=A0ABU0HD13_9HYPH|nr:periplasmic heavy metal sensor [Kaistia dalseonensis]MCX5497571.1 periplasmic heavy metal sensor [Kaistia dalseonensis]MDQ0440211.1 putative membrane protein [Kaistia dalseonensis]